MAFCLVSLREKMKGRMKRRRNVVCDKFSVRTHSEWKTSFSFNFHNPAGARYFCPTQTSDLVFKQLMTCLRVQLFLMSHQRDHIMFSQTRLRKGLLWTLKIGLTHPPGASSTHSSRLPNPSLLLLFNYSSKQGQSQAKTCFPLSFIILPERRLPL